MKRPQCLACDIAVRTTRHTLRAVELVALDNGQRANALQIAEMFPSNADRAELELQHDLRARITRVASKLPRLSIALPGRQCSKGLVESEVLFTILNQAITHLCVHTRFCCQAKELTAGWTRARTMTLFPSETERQENWLSVEQEDSPRNFCILNQRHTQQVTLVAALGASRV